MWNLMHSLFMKFRMLYLDLTWHCNTVELPCMTTSSKRPPPISKSVKKIFLVKALQLEPLINDHLSYNVSNHGHFLGSSIIQFQNFPLLLTSSISNHLIQWSDLCVLCKSVILLQIVIRGESWDSSSEKIMSPSPEPLNPSS